MKKARLLNAIFIALTSVCFFSSWGVVSANATTVRWVSDYGSNGLIASFTIPTDVVFTVWNTPITVSGSEYTFMLGNSSHAPTQGVAAQVMGRSDTLGLIAYSGWYWNQSQLDWVNSGPFVQADFFNFDYPSGLVPVSNQSDPPLIHLYDGIIIYASTGLGYLTNVSWGDHTLTIPDGGEDWGYWDIAGFTLPTENPKPIGPPPSVPEPATMLLLGLGLMGLAGIRRKFKN